MSDELPGAVEDPLLFEIGHPGVGVVARVQARLERFEFDALGGAAALVDGCLWTELSRSSRVMRLSPGILEFGTELTN